jgi:D-alanine-D-alanine ligase
VVDFAQARARLIEIDRLLCAHGQDLALFLVYDRPARVIERPGLSRTYFAERCVSDAQLDDMLSAFREIGAYAELLDGEQALMGALATGHIDRVRRPLSVVYNGIGWGVGVGGFEPGRKALVPALADSYGLLCTGSDPYVSGLTTNKFHSFLVLRALGVKIAPIWHYDLDRGWVGPRPSQGLKIIVKSTYEAWSVGVTEESVFVVDSSCDERVAAIAHGIGQAVTVQQFIPGTEVSIPVIGCPELYVLPPMRQTVLRAPNDPNAFTTVDDSMHRGVAFAPLDGSPSLLATLHRSTTGIFNLLGMRALGRIDFRIDEGERPWVTDVAIEPGWGRRSSACASFAELNIAYPSFLRLTAGVTLAWAGVLSASSEESQHPGSGDA